MSNPIDDLILEYEHRRGPLMSRCQYETAEFNGDTGVARFVPCSHTATWLDHLGRQFCNDHPTPWDAEQAKVLIQAIAHDRQELEQLRKEA